MNIFRKIFHWCQDRYLTWRTGLPRAEREWRTWRGQNVNIRANSVEDMFRNFKYVIRVDPDKFFDPLSWKPNVDAQEFFFPARTIKDCCVWEFARIRQDTRANRTVIDDCFGEDACFVATNSSMDATIITLRWA
jgi:hypothetical protein